jgi:hypothetical protein
MFYFVDFIVLIVEIMVAAIQIGKQFIQPGNQLNKINVLRICPDCFNHFPVSKVPPAGGFRGALFYLRPILHFLVG